MKHVVITIGREYGSGGRLIAKQLSEELGITFYDKELITEVARKTGFSENFIRDSEHQRPTNSFLYDLYTAVQTPSVPDQCSLPRPRSSRRPRPGSPASSWAGAPTTFCGTTPGG